MKPFEKKNSKYVTVNSNGRIYLSAGVRDVIETPRVELSFEGGKVSIRECHKGGFLLRQGHSVGVGRNAIIGVGNVSEEGEIDLGRYHFSTMTDGIYEFERK